MREMKALDKNSPWIAIELKFLMISRDRLKKAIVKHKSPTMMCSYKAICNRVNSLNIMFKKRYFTHKIVECKGNMKETGKTTNALLNTRCKSPWEKGDLEHYE